MTKKQINLGMSDPLLSRLEAECARVGVPMQPLIRVLIDEALSVREKRRAEQAQAQFSAAV